mgnify:CR=1 FL=1
MRILFFILLLALGCVNISNVGNVRDEICVGEKYNEYFCYFGKKSVTSIDKEECLEYGYGQNKGSLKFSYFENMNCQEFCTQAYDSGLECTIIVFK